MRDPNVKVSVIYDTDTKQVALRISLRSDKKKDLWARDDIPLNELNFGRVVCAKTERLVEHLGKRWGDNLNVDECIKLVLQSTKEVLANMNGQNTEAVNSGI